MPTLSNTNYDLKLEGVYTALVTPFHPDGSIDYRAFEKLLDRQLAAGVAGVVPCGTTGESPTLSQQEKIKLMELTVAKCKGKALVIAGTGSNDTAKTIEEVKSACAAGVDVVMVVTPYYNKPSQSGLFAHFTAAADASSKPIILYNVPGRTVASIQAATVGKLSQNKKIIGIKEATGNLPLLTDIRNAVSKSSPGKQFSYLSGDDGTFWPFLACGGDGVISVSSNVLPKLMVLIFESWKSGKTKDGLRLHEASVDWINALFVEANPIPVKTLLNKLGLLGVQFRLPLSPMMDETRSKLISTWEQLPSTLQIDSPKDF